MDGCSNSHFPPQRNFRTSILVYAVSFSSGNIPKNGKIFSRLLMKRYIYAMLLMGACPLVADEQGSHQDNFPTAFTPWFTGPLIAPSGYTVKSNHYNIEPYLY